VHATELRSVDSILSEIMQVQDVSNIDSIDISKVTLSQLEELGDSVMEKVVGSTATHERLDNALGGEGSSSLTNIHIRVGYNYLAGIPITMMTFMGVGGMMTFGGMMGGNGYFPLNGNYYNGYGMMGNFGWIWMVVGTLIFISLVIGGIYLVSQSTKKQESFTPETRKYDKAMILLKERYARGEITRDEFSRMKDDLK
jgi:putative membrane protein